MFATPWSMWAASTEFLEFMLTLGMGLYYTVYIITPFWYGQTHMCKRPTHQPLPVAHDQHLLPVTQWSLPPTLAEGRHVLGTCGGAVVHGRDYSYIMCSTPTGAFHVAAGRKVFACKEEFCGWRCHAARLNTSMNGLAQPQSGDCCDMGRSFCCNGIPLRPWNGDVQSLCAL